MKIFIIFFLLSFVSLHSQEFRKHILFLTADSLNGRYPATEGEQIAADYIISELLKSNCEIYIQKFPFEKSKATNILGIFDRQADSTIIISAHYDHLGNGSNKSREIVRKGIHPGADDNASGVSLILELSKQISKNKKLKYNYIIAAWSGHEAGLLGSEFFTRSGFYRSLKVAAVINIDMIGRLNLTNPTLRVSGAIKNLKFSEILNEYDDKFISFRFDDENIMKSDLKYFAIDGVDVLNLTTGIHDDYHKLSDTESKINYDGIYRILNLVNYLIDKI
ncbi:MAG: M28 family peptidase [Candidatus Kapabacteria bacterium]|nr:M28 family peptidase [Candidatus Kapabacteria bacterium]